MLADLPLHGTSTTLTNAPAAAAGSSGADDHRERVRTIAVLTFLAGAVATAILASIAAFTPGVWLAVGVVALHVPVVTVLAAYEATPSRHRGARFVDHESTGTGLANAEHTARRLSGPDSTAPARVRPRAQTA